MIGDADCICHDPRKPEGSRDYAISFDQCMNYVATNPDDYDAQQEWISRNCFGPRKRK